MILNIFPQTLMLIIPVWCLQFHYR